MGQWKRKHKIIKGKPHAQCSRCHKWFPETEAFFYPSGSFTRVDGSKSFYLRPECTLCTKAATLARQQAHPEKQRAQKRAYYHRDPAGRIKATKRNKLLRKLRDLDVHIPPGLGMGKVHRGPLPSGPEREQPPD